MTEKILTLSIASLIGGLFFYLRLPIPFMLGGIIAAAGVKFFLWPEIHWPARWRNLGLLVACLLYTSFYRGLRLDPALRAQRVYYPVVQ